jgi:hypothetical protein
MMTPNSTARTFFEEVKNYPTGSFAYIENLIATRAEENEWREFKGAHHLTTNKDKHTNLLEIWSQALSAFANANGGVLIWGIDALKMVAERASYVVDVHLLASKLRDKILTAVEPFVPGVEILPVPRDGSSEGFVVCLIPQSKHAPHQAAWPYRQFFLRCLDGSHPCPYAVLKKLFYPTSCPVLVPNSKLTVSRSDDGFPVLSGSLWVKNQGNASAHDIFFMFGGDANLYPAPWWEGVPGMMNAFRSDHVIHPRQTLHVAANVQKNFLPDFAGVPKILKFWTKIYARDTLPLQHNFSISFERLQEAFISGKLFEVDVEETESL